VLHTILSDVSGMATAIDYDSINTEVRNYMDDWKLQSESAAGFLLKIQVNIPYVCGKLEFVNVICLCYTSV
jgi:hypothetical protein